MYKFRYFLYTIILFFISFNINATVINKEISSKYIIGDSEYSDKKISNLDPYERKTKIDQW